MKYKIFFLILILFASSGYAQDQNEEKQRALFDSKYGNDASLIEGKVYFPELNIVDGDPFWGNSKLPTGTIVLQGKKHVNQQIKYDLYNQNFILVYQEASGAEKQIIIDRDKIDSIYIGGAVFIPNPIAQIERCYIQLVYEKNIQVYIGWSKQKTLDLNSNARGYSFSREMNTKYMIYNKTLFTINNNQQLIKPFTADNRKIIRAYLNKRKIRMKDIDLIKLKELSAFIEGLISKI